MKRILCLLLLTVCLFAQSKPDITEFMLFKRKDPIKVGDVSLALRGTDKNHQKYNIDLIIDNQRLELKDQYAKIPIRFYVGTETEAHELVITSVSDDQVTGRIVSPAK
jgi:hypothetical protein